MTAIERIRGEIEQWFLTDPMLFAVFHTHRLEMNANIQCAIRTGQGRLEYNPTFIDTLKDDQLRDLMKVEMVRILLQHPYARQPLGCKPGVQKMASDMVISPAYKLPAIDITKPEDAGLPEGQYYEWYAMRLNELPSLNLFGFPPEGDAERSQGQGESSSEGGKGDDGMKEKESEESSGGDSLKEQRGESNEERCNKSEEKGTGTDGDEGYAESESMSIDSPSEGDGREGSEDSAATDYAALWDEDQFLSRQITEIVQSTTNWGMMPGGMVELIQKAAEGKIDFRGALRTFRASILSQKRSLTRMRPSRRFGFEQMGSHYNFTTRLLIAIDTSGSVGSEKLARYLRIINTFFKYGIEEVDVLMFDTEVQGKPLTIKESRKHLDSLLIKGRGGTNFQAPVDYVKAHPDYDGLVIITDGYGPTPEVPAHLRAKLLWVIDNEKSFEMHYKDLRATGRVCLMQL
jgi:predicted metal-dependent peptidase